MTQQNQKNKHQAREEFAELQEYYWLDGESPGHLVISSPSPINISISWEIREIFEDESVTMYLPIEGMKCLHAMLGRAIEWAEKQNGPT